MNKLELKKLEEMLYSCYCKELCYPKVKEKWNEHNKYFGMCAITALFINDYYGGDIGKIYVNNISHYFNIVNNEIIDLTAKQFNNKIEYIDYEIKNRTDILNEDTQKRYILLKQRMVNWDKTNVN